MASRRKLKKEICFVTNELFFECNINHLLIKKISEEKYNETIQKIAILNEEYISRVNHPNGTKNYYKKLRNDFNQEIQTINDVFRSTGHNPDDFTKCEHLYQD